MTASDANNATWYILRYAVDFSPRPASANDPAPPEFVPPDAPALVYDDSRHVLELMPAPPAQEASPPPGLVVGLEGEIYRVDGSGRNLLWRRCDGSEKRLLCEPGIVIAPAGLALDRRGFLYTADPAAGRVVVLRPEDASSVAVLSAGLIEPVDVAVSPNGQIFIADRAAGRIVRYNAGFIHIGDFVAQGPAGLPAKARPIAVMLDLDGTLLVADGNYPWLLRFAPDGLALADVSLPALAGPLAAAGVSLDDPSSLLPCNEPQVIAGACAGPFTMNHSGEALARMHRAIRLLALNLSHSFVTRGVFLSAALDSGAPGTVWHKLVLDAALPQGGWVTVETATSDAVSDLAGANLPWSSPQNGNGPIPFAADLPDQLVQSRPGRHLRLRITLGSDGRETPSLNSLKVLYPRGSYLNLLPRIYQRDAESALFLQHYLALFEHVLTGIEDRYDAFATQLDPRAAPAEVVDWLAQLLDLSFDPSWPLSRRRALVAEAASLYSRRGTIAGLSRFIEIYTGKAPLILESYRVRPGQPPILGIVGSFLGCGICLTRASPTEPAETSFGASFAHRFAVLIYQCEWCDSQTMLPVVERIISMNKPAHTAHTLLPVYPDARVGEQSTVGIDYVIGGGIAPSMRIDELPKPKGPKTPKGALGINTVLTDVRPGYARPVTQVL
jgi:phage tail-like protein